jgi:hypothetical protein
MNKERRKSALAHRRMNNSHIGATVGSFLNISGNGIEIFILNVFLFIWALSVNVNEVIKSSERTP